MSERYRLPATLGGRIVVGRPVAKDGSTVAVVVENHEVVLPVAMLTLIAEPEPDPGAWVAVRLESGAWLVFHHVPQDDQPPWYCHDTGNRITWREVRVLGEVVNLRPAMFGSGHYGRCTGCNIDRPVRMDGNVAVHGHRSKPCKGSNNPPAVTE